MLPCKQENIGGFIQELVAGQSWAAAEVPDGAGVGLVGSEDGDLR